MRGLSLSGLVLLGLISSSASATVSGPGSVLDLQSAGLRTDVKAEAHAESRLTPELRACIFHNTLAFGASITHGSPSGIPGYGYAVKKYEQYEAHVGASPSTGAIPKPKSYRPYGRNPVRYLVKMLAGKSALQNIAYVSQPGTRDNEHLGSQQLRKIILDEGKDLLARATILVGVDAFYMDAAWSTCGTTLDPVAEIEAITTIARSRGKTVVLGTVPIEDPRLVRVDARRVGLNFIWKEPESPCASEINAALRQNCIPENNCYLVDLQKDVEVLKNGGKLQLAGVGSFGYYEMRPDGVNLSDVGSHYVAQTIAKALIEHPPVCTKTDLHWTPRYENLSY